VFDIDKLTFVYPEEFVRLETEYGERLSVYSKVDRLVEPGATGCGKVPSVSLQRL
jgi:hypothetical protein